LKGHAALAGIKELRFFRAPHHGENISTENLRFGSTILVFTGIPVFIFFYLILFKQKNQGFLGKKTLLKKFVDEKYRFIETKQVLMSSFEAKNSFRLF